MCNHEGNTKEGYYLTSETRIDVASVPEYTGYIVRGVYPPWNHLIWCDNLHLSGVYVRLPNQVRIFCLLKTYFIGTQEHNIRRIFLNICNTLHCYLNMTAIFDCITCWRKQSLA